MRKVILIILPYGNLNPEEKRDEQLALILEELTRLTQSVEQTYFVMVAEQIKPKKYFNRGQLLNIGLRFFKDTVGQPTVMILHDIDLIPNKTLFEEYNNDQHDSYNLLPIKSEKYKQIYNFKLTTGSAIYLTKPELFIKANGYPNNYWGWGGEDNALDVRYRLAKNAKLYYNYNRGSFISNDIQRESNYDKIKYLKKNKIRNMMTKELLRNEKNTWKTNGYEQLDDLDYEIVDHEIQELTPNLFIIHIKIKLDQTGLKKIIKHNKQIYKLLDKNNTT